jgi:glycosyltransferase involved in cell wall biosynthesis
LNQALLSICIPAYNRPKELLALIQSVDCDPTQVEIVIAEDKSPGREAIGQAVRAFSASSPYRILYHENPVNLGYDGNIRNLVALASGRWVLFMGDDDLFVPTALDRFLEFLGQQEDKKYVLRSYVVEHDDGKVERFQYLPTTTPLEAGEATVSWLFKRSVTICGFTIDRDLAHAAASSELDGTLLYQIYLMAEVCLLHPSVYCDFPVARAVQTYRQDKPMFGASEAEKGKYTPGSISPDNSINFSRAYLDLCAWLDHKHGTHLGQSVLLDLSKYSYPFLSIQRKRGRKAFLAYAKRLETELGFGISVHFHLYKWGLAILGEKACDGLIILVKRLVGHTPNF